MSSQSQRAQLDAAASKAGLVVLNEADSQSFDGRATVKYTVALASNSAKTETLEISESFLLDTDTLRAGLTTYFTESAKRLLNPQPDFYITLGGLPISFHNFQWPFHRSTSGADSYVVHGEAFVEDGKTGVEQLRAKVSGSMTVTFSEIIAAPEQIFSEGFIYNAIRKILDQGQLELTKSGNRQPVPVTTRYYSTKQSKFIFNDTTDEQRQDYLAAKVYWLSGIFGNNAPVWLLDPRDAQYLNTTVAVLKKTAEDLASDGIFTLQSGAEFAVPTESLMNHGAEYQSAMDEAIAFSRPTFNEEMRGGHTNM